MALRPARASPSITSHPIRGWPPSLLESPGAPTGRAPPSAFAPPSTSSFSSCPAPLRSSRLSRKLLPPLQSPPGSDEAQRRVPSSPSWTSHRAAALIDPSSRATPTARTQYIVRDDPGGIGDLAEGRAYGPSPCPPTKGRPVKRHQRSTLCSMLVFVTGIDPTEAATFKRAFARFFVLSVALFTSEAFWAVN
ncbi:hypothetical protein DFH09DRAFT_1328145 [Mycena vulgaris]|nr:hypothetical protein DFH09DRAFT_1328145 [Mycena vulgaris]